jgi:hypothetical protein
MARPGGGRVAIGLVCLTSDGSAPVPLSEERLVKTRNPTLPVFCAAAALAVSTLPVASALAESGAAKARAARVIEFWTPARRAQAEPRDLLIDPRGLGYLRRSDGGLTPYGHQLAAASTATPVPKAPPGGNDTTPPQISNLDPANGATIGTAYTFAASVTDDSGVKSVSFVLTYPDGVTTQSFAAANTTGSTWSVGLSGFTAGNWRWQVIAKDKAKRGGNTATSPPANFTVSSGGGGGGGGDGVVANAEWAGGGDIQQTAGRVYFEMPANARRKGPWSAYVCSGTVVTDGVSGRSVILTAAHCVYDDVNDAFARNVLFIPNQAGTSGSGTDTNCGNDPIGCWVPSFGVVDVNWTQSVFPDNIPWDYAFYVVADDGSHRSGINGSSDILDSAVPALDIQFATPAVDDGAAGSGSPDFTHALGYSYSEDPKFMYCAEDMTTEGADNWWLPSCGLTGGSSGGPWAQPLSNGTGPLISVNSWGYTNSPGMAGPKLSGNSASCVYNTAATAAFLAQPADGDAGYAVNCN